MMNFEGAYPGGCTDGVVAFILTSALFVGYVIYAHRYRTKSAVIAATVFAFLVTVCVLHSLHLVSFFGDLAVFHFGCDYTDIGLALPPIIPFVSRRYPKSTFIKFYLVLCAATIPLGILARFSPLHPGFSGPLLVILLPLLFILEPIAMAKSILMDFEQE